MVPNVRVLSVFLLVAAITPWAAPLAGRAEASTLFVSDDTTIKGAERDGTNKLDLVTSEPTYIQGLALDEQAGKIYWTIDGGPNDFVKRANLDGTGQETLVTLAGGNTLRRIALNVAANKMYYADEATDVIWRANLDGTGQEVLLATQAPMGLALDLVNGKMYWASNGWGIQRANLDGTGGETLVMELSNGIDVDPVAGKMYYADYVGGRLRRAELDGTNPEDVITGLSTPSAPKLDLGPASFGGQKVYWTEGPPDIAHRANLDGTGQETVMSSLGGGGSGLAVAQTTPEPSSVVLLLLAGGGVVLTRRRRGPPERPTCSEAESPSL